MPKIIEESKLDLVLLYNEKYFGIEESYLLFVINSLAKIFINKVQQNSNKDFDLKDFCFSQETINYYESLLKCSLNFHKYFRYIYHNESIITDNLGFIVKPRERFMTSIFALDNKKIFNQLQANMDHDLLVSKIYQAIGEKVLLWGGYQYQSLFALANYDILNYENQLHSFNLYEEHPKLKRVHSYR